MRYREHLNRTIAVLGTPLSLVTTLASIPLLLPITIPLIFLALIITLLLVLLALLAVLLVVLVILLKQLPQLLQPQTTPRNDSGQSQTQSPKVEQSEPGSKHKEHIRSSSNSTFASRRRPMLHTPEFSHHRTGSCHESQADTMVSAPVYDFSTNGTTFGIDSPRKGH